MLVAIISDIHDNLTNLWQCLAWCNKQKVKTIICCGDLTNDDTLEVLTTGFKGDIHLIKGNADSFDERKIAGYKNIKYYDRAGGRILIDGLVIGFCHEPFLYKKLIEKEKFDLIFYGHTHKPWESNEKGTRLINPGTLSGMFLKSTFAVLDSETGEVSLKILEEM
ncbi:MAG: Phosphodiesterase, MJ0936 family [Parcubacteria group bacterium GW2011_GWE2_39_37]|uniref:Phosphoesterase n=1 Tax=Candidatus Falkowbacteria bacterium GW2011_GWF2_39_8 TaxID=1618642 RepID=A0A0G0SEP5_9BACT|nr:MAG: Phosphodiesterase, MJ0936 family [Parcubacteria group bacterium GW2011_GWE2_39_37]KKR33175.1 MAG: Phosphodiesterase, MJ0936 family [Candidatus Falkowbacteria bacterium GW2011_GWF2_39_8]